MGQRLQDKVAFVTGIGSAGPGWGTGKAAAVLFAREGAKVFGVENDHGAGAKSTVPNLRPVAESMTTRRPPPSGNR